MNNINCMHGSREWLLVRRCWLRNREKPRKLTSWHAVILGAEKSGKSRSIRQQIVRTYWWLELKWLHQFGI